MAIEQTKTSEQNTANRGNWKFKNKNGDNRNRQSNEVVLYGSAEWEKRHLALVAEVNESVIKGNRSHDRFQQTPEEKAELKKIKKSHVKELRKYGVDPKKQLNVIIDDVIAYKERLAKKFKVA